VTTGPKREKGNKRHETVFTPILPELKNDTNKNTYLKDSFNHLYWSLRNRVHYPNVTDIYECEARPCTYNPIVSVPISCQIVLLLEKCLLYSLTPQVENVMDISNLSFWKYSACSFEKKGDFLRNVCVPVYDYEGFLTFVNFTSENNTNSTSSGSDQYSKEVVIGLEDKIEVLIKKLIEVKKKKKILVVR
jgi:hypothetical protein